MQPNIEHTLLYAYTADIQGFPQPLYYQALRVARKRRSTEPFRMFEMLAVVTNIARVLLL
jgi:hypothetical protein